MQDRELRAVGGTLALPVARHNQHRTAEWLIRHRRTTKWTRALVDGRFACAVIRADEPYDSSSRGITGAIMRRCRARQCPDDRDRDRGEAKVRRGADHYQCRRGSTAFVTSPHRVSAHRA
jgi:hypothetical protein